MAQQSSSTANAKYLRSTQFLAHRRFSRERTRLAYEALLARVSADVKPKRTSLKRFGFATLSTMTWEIFRWRTNKSELISQAIPTKLAECLDAFVHEHPAKSAGRGMRTQEFIAKWAKRNPERWVKRTRTSFCCAVSKQTNIFQDVVRLPRSSRKLENIERVDRSLGLAESRRNQYCARSSVAAQRSPNNLRNKIEEVEDAEFETIAPEIRISRNNRTRTLHDDAKIKANRANARASTGPRTRQGKVRSAQNAYRHGFNVSVLTTNSFGRRRKSRASKIAGERASAEVLETARRVAEAQIELRRVREARRVLLDKYLSDPKYKRYMTSPAKLKERLRVLGRLGAMMIRMTPHEICDPSFQKLASSVEGEPPQGAKKFVYILADLTKRLSAIDRTNAAHSRAASLPFAN